MMLAAVTQFRVPSRPVAASLPVAVETTSDHELMIAVRAGEIRRLGDLFERYHKPLYGFFVRLTNQPSVGEDLVQIVFYRILKYRHTYRDEGKFSAWIYHLARKVAADHFRKHASTPTPTDPAVLHEQPAPEPQPSEQAATAEDVVLLRTALARLPLEHREVLVLSRLQHLEHKEIARLLDCSVGAVKVRAHRALKELREVYFKIRKEKAA
ncbi:RNA polymerase sigma factor [Opitutus sp. GAS368]|jgi:RNA polymerase sigma factor (sigma-70 family)|uniref:RNA polymerase sigma factor n=1 Tax=Opitutus sp. GAS368 TaxID=1882749 RepID=UPI00087B285D|nr:RNA polymerase sigma factor [Opitutus sp. GAS368]SDR93512.1 RNA polymerase sigma-70 factor, ECF subfamily [Opitutus sp. GAS368]